MGHPRDKVGLIRHGLPSMASQGAGRLAEAWRGNRGRGEEGKTSPQTVLEMLQMLKHGEGVALAAA